MRFSVLAFLLLFNLAVAQEKIDEVPPPPLINEADWMNAPEVHIIQQENTRFEEYRKGGKLYMVKVTPAIGPAYYLVDFRGDGRFERLKQGIGDGTPPIPRWVLFSW